MHARNRLFVGIEPTAAESEPDPARFTPIPTARMKIIHHARLAAIAVPFAIALAAIPSSTASAQGVPAFPGAPIPARPGPAEGSRLVKLSIAPDPILVEAGKPALVAAVLSIDQGWHVYWKNPGDSGVAPRLRWTLPEGLVARAIRWPRPRVFASEHETNFGYEHEVGLVVAIEAAPDVKPGRYSGSVRADWMVCKELCLIGGGSVDFAIEVLAAGDPAAEGISIQAGEMTLPRDATVRTWFGRLPLAVPPGSGIETALEGDPADANEGLRLVVTGPAGSFDRVAFIPDSTPGTTCGEGQPVAGTIDAGRFRLEVPLSVRPSDATGERLRAAGLLMLGGQDDDPSFEIEVPIPVTSAPPAGS